jgi:hypothetical protein
MTRARVEAVAGDLESVSFDPGAHRLEVHYAGRSDVTAPDVIAIGAGAATPAASWKATCDGAPVATGGSDPLQVACGGAGEHVVVVSAP